MQHWANSKLFRWRSKVDTNLRTLQEIHTPPEGVPGHCNFLLVEMTNVKPPTHWYGKAGLPTLSEEVLVVYGKEEVRNRFREHVIKENPGVKIIEKDFFVDDEEREKREKPKPQIVPSRAENGRICPIFSKLRRVNGTSPERKQLTVNFET